MSPALDKHAERWQRLPRWVRLPFVATVGATVVATGIALLVLPGPGLLVIALGIGILATEFAWARRSLHRGREGLRRVWPRRSVQQADSPKANDVP